MVDALQIKSTLPLVGLSENVITVDTVSMFYWNNLVYPVILSKIILKRAIINKFLADPSLGRLSKWLRTLVFDTVYFSNPLDEKLFFEKARSEYRLILTRSGKLSSQLKEGDYCFITFNHIDEQLKELIDKGLIPQPEHLFTRCAECNEILKKIDRDMVHGKVPDYIRETQESFRQCPDCKKIFWAGTHCKRMKEKINRLYGKDPDET